MSKHQVFFNLFKDDIRNNKNIYYHNMYCPSDKIHFIGFHKKEDIMLECMIGYLKNFNLKYSLRKIRDIFRLQINFHSIVITI